MSTRASSASSWSLILKQNLKAPAKSPRFLASQTSNFPNGSNPPPFYWKVSALPRSSFLPKAYFSSYPMGDNVVRDLLAELELEKKKERDERKRKGLGTEDIDREDEEDYMGVMPLIEKLQKEKWNTEDLMLEEEPTDSDSEDEVDQNEEEKAWEMFETKLERHKELLKNFAEAETLDETFQWMSRIDKYEQKHFPLRPEYRVIGELMNRLKVAEGKEKFILQHKLNRAMRIVDWKEAYDPNNPANYGVIQRELDSAPQEQEEQAADEGEKVPGDEEEDEEESDDEKEKDEILLEKLNTIDKALEEKLAQLEHTFGKKGKLLEAEIKHLAEERNDLTEQKRRPLYRKGFDMRLIDMNRTCKVTKGGQVVRYSAIVACGNYNGVIGFAKGKGPAVPIALQKAYEKSFQNLHYVERHEEHTIAHAVQTSYKKTKVYLWPSPTRTGMKAGRVVQNILHLAGFKNVKSKVVGSRNPHNTVKALLKALNAIETPKDVQEKFGRVVVEKYLLG